MLRLSPGAFDRTALLIERYGLHDDDAIMPVPIKQVAKEEGWKICYHSQMGKAIAMAFCIGGIKLMYVNANLGIRTQRLGIAHELGHELAGHMLPIDTHMGKQYRREGLGNTTDAQEDEASVISGLLLVPRVVRESPMTDDEVAMLCTVPVGAVRLVRNLEPIPLALVS